ncbi:MAG: hypothetical protein QXO30_03695 [Candidatus Caldarchaeum sp.]
MPFRVMLFVQGRGWVSLHELTGHSDVVDSRETGLMLGCTLVLEKLSKSQKPLGSSEGDWVGFRLDYVDDEEPRPVERPLLDWVGHRHFFFKRDDAYFLYKTWSWPD